MHPIMNEDLARARRDDEMRRARCARLVRQAIAVRRHALTDAAGAGGKRRIAARSWGYARAPRRTLAAAAAIEAVLACAWFGWGQAGPPPILSVVLALGAVEAALVGLLGLIATHQFRTDPSALRGQTYARRYGIVVGTEFAIAGIGAVMMSGFGATQLIAAWVCLAVGIHFVPLDRMFPGAGMVPLAAALSLVGMAAFAVDGTGVLPSTVTGLGAGVVLLGHAGSMLFAARRRGRGANAPNSARALTLPPAPPVPEFRRACASLGTGARNPCPVGSGRPHPSELA